MANLSPLWETIKRPVFDPGVLFGLASALFMVKTGWVYAVIMFVFTVLSVWASASPLRLRVPVIGMWVSAAGQMLAALAAFIMLGWPMSAPVLLPFVLFGLANISNGFELSYPQKWLAFPRWVRVLIVGELFAVAGTGFLLFFLSAEGIGYTITLVATIVAAVCVFIQRSDLSRFAIGTGSALAGGVAMLAGISFGVVASFILSAASYRVWWLKREARLTKP